MERRERESAVALRDWRREKAIPSFHVREFASRPFVKSLSLALSVFLTDQCVCDNFRPFCPHFHSAFQFFFLFLFLFFFSFVKRKFH